MAVALLLLISCGTDSTPTSAAVTSTTTTAAPTTTVDPAKLAVASAVGDIEAGEALYFLEMDGVPHDLACAGCDTLDGIDGRSPSLAGISDRAGSVVPGMPAADFLKQSIVEPATVREDWPAVMPVDYGKLLTEEEINDLIAFLLTQ